MAGFQRLGATQRTIMEALEEAGDILLAFLLSAGSSRLFTRNLRESPRERSRKAMHASIEALKRRRFVKMVEKNGEQHVMLTQNGKQTLLKCRWEDMKLPRVGKWDGKWHLVIFDIPEKHGKARRALSYKIQQMGALRLQDSVFVYPFPWKNEIDFIVEFFHVGPFMRYLTATEVEGEKELRRHFGI